MTNSNSLNMLPADNSEPTINLSGVKISKKKIQQIQKIDNINNTRTRMEHIIRITTEGKEATINYGYDEKKRNKDYNKLLKFI